MDSSISAEMNPWSCCEIWVLNHTYVLLNQPAYEDSEPQSKPLSVESEKGAPWSTVRNITQGRQGFKDQAHRWGIWSPHGVYADNREESTGSASKPLPVTPSVLRSDLSSHGRSKKLAGVGALCRAYCILDCVLCTPKPNQITSCSASTVAAKPPLSPVPTLALCGSSTEPHSREGARTQPWEHTAFHGFCLVLTIPLKLNSIMVSWTCSWFFRCEKDFNSERKSWFPHSTPLD